VSWFPSALTVQICISAGNGECIWRQWHGSFRFRRDDEESRLCPRADMPSSLLVFAFTVQKELLLCLWTLIAVPPPLDSDSCDVLQGHKHHFVHLPLPSLSAQFKCYSLGSLFFWCRCFFEFCLTIHVIQFLNIYIYFVILCFITK
jgi:hypothetical protein